MSYTIQDVLSQLSLGPLSNLSMSNDGNGTISEAAQPQLISCLNNSLIKLYSRFPLREDEVVLHMITGRTRYTIDSRYSVSFKLANPASTNPVYVMDHARPYQDDLIKVMEIFNIYGDRMLLNDTEQPGSLFTPFYNIIQVPQSVDLTAISVLYQARHPELSPADLTAAVDVPDALRPALLNDIASQVFSNMNGVENSAKSQEHAASYEMICARIVENDLTNMSISQENTKFTKRGFM